MSDVLGALGARTCRLTCRRCFQLQGLRSFGLLYYNAATALPLSLTIAYMRGEIDELLVFSHRLNPVRREAVCRRIPPRMSPLSHMYG